MVTAGFIFVQNFSLAKTFYSEPNQFNSIQYIKTTELFKYEICHLKSANFFSKYFLKPYSIINRLIHQILHMNTSLVL